VVGVGQDSCTIGWRIGHSVIASNQVELGLKDGVESQGYILMVCTYGLVSPNHQSWYQWGSKACLVQKVVNCSCSFWVLVCLVGLSH